MSHLLQEDWGPEEGEEWPETKPKVPTAPTSFQPQAATFKSATTQPAKAQKYVVKGSQPESVNKHKDSIDDFSGY